MVRALGKAVGVMLVTCVSLVIMGLTYKFVLWAFGG